MRAIADRSVNHRLLVAGEVVGELVPGFEKRLSHSGNVAVAEDAEAAGEETVALAVALNLLGCEEAHQCLGDGQSHGRPRCDVIGNLGSGS